MPSALTPTEMPEPALVMLLFDTVVSDPPELSRLIAVRVQLVVLPSMVMAMPPPSDQMPRPQLAVPNSPCDAPDIRLSVMLTAPLATGET